MIARFIGRTGAALTRLAYRHGHHTYLSTGCLHGDLVLPDGRTGHDYCRTQARRYDGTTKAAAVCKFCSELGRPGHGHCVCPCHTTPTGTT